MLELPTPKRRRAHWLAIALLGGAAALSSCATQKPAPNLVSDPDAVSGSAIPWNRPANWEGRGNIPSNIGGNDAFGANGNGGTGGY